MKIDAGTLEMRELNDLIKLSPDENIEVTSLMGQRYIAAGSKNKHFSLYGIPGNDLGAFLDGSSVEVFSNAEDATGDTMNDGSIIIHGSVGDATGYAMRGGKIYIRDSAGYRTGIHMKAYKEKQPLIIIGGSAGSFLGEYQAGGTIIVLGLDKAGRPPVGFFTGTGMHGGRIILRAETLPPDLPAQVAASGATEDEKNEIASLINEFCSFFSFDRDEIMKNNFFILRPNSKAPYKRLYTQL